MNVAARELCQELYEVSGWQPVVTSQYGEYWLNVDARTGADTDWHIERFFGPIAGYPAYDLGYLLRKLPTGIQLYKGKKGYTFQGGGTIEPKLLKVLRYDNFSSDTPEDAATKLAIELFKHGTLTKAGDA